jgi:hypothetical protein
MISRNKEIRQINIRSRNQLRNILASGSDNGVTKLDNLRKTMGSREALALERVLSSGARINGSTPYSPFPKNPPFKDVLRSPGPKDLTSLLAFVDKNIIAYEKRLTAQVNSLSEIDKAISKTSFQVDSKIFFEHIKDFGWSHAILRRIIVVRENNVNEDEQIEKLVIIAGLKQNSLIVNSLIQAYATEQNYLIAKRSVLNVADRGNLNRYTRVISRITFEPLVKNETEMFFMLAQIAFCSIVDSIIFIKANSHIVDFAFLPKTKSIIDSINNESTISQILAVYNNFDDAEYRFLKQSGVWLEYSLVRNYRILVDNFYDASGEIMTPIHHELDKVLQRWVEIPNITDIISGKNITRHANQHLSNLEATGVVTRSAIFNYWLYVSKGEVTFNRDDLSTLMGLTRDLARTIPIAAARVAVTYSQDEQVKLILLLLLAKRSKNEKDSYQLRRLMQRLCLANNNNSLVELVKSYEKNYAEVSDYIYEIATEDFLAKCSGLAPDLSDIPEIRAQLHEWKAKISGNEFYLERARAVRIDHQMNRVRDEIDDHRIYVDPSRFSSWINDELMVDLNSSLTLVGINKKNTSVNADETLLNSIVQRSYSAFCTNAVFGIASYIGRRIRHGTFRGHLYSSIINALESSAQFRTIRRDQNFLPRWTRWKEQFSSEINQIINERLHVYSRQKPHGLLQPDLYTPQKQEIIAASVRTISATYTETKTTEDFDIIFTEYCWRLAEADLQAITKYLKSKDVALKNVYGLDDMVITISSPLRRPALEFKREVVHAIDTKLRTMYGWFKRPSNISPKASLSLLYNAVVAEVRDTFPLFSPEKSNSETVDVDLIGGAYHVLYDSLYVIVFNAAKHGHPDEPVEKSFSILEQNGAKRLVVEIINTLSPKDSPADVAEIVEQRRKANHDDANLYEKRSGIPKLMQLAHTRSEFEIEALNVVANKLIVRFSYALEH